MYTLPIVQNGFNEVHKFPKVNSTLNPIVRRTVFFQKVVFNRAAGGKVVCLRVGNGAKHDDKELSECWGV